MIRNIPLVTKNLLLINLIAFLAMLALKSVGIDLNGLLGLHFFLADNFHIYQLVTYMFMLEALNTYFLTCSPYGCLVVQ